VAALTDIYIELLDWAEDGGLVLGIVSVQSWLDFANLVLLDLLKQTGVLSESGPCRYLRDAHLHGPG